jgi:urease accessory protein
MNAPRVSIEDDDAPANRHGPRMPCKHGPGQSPRVASAQATTVPPPMLRVIEVRRGPSVDPARVVDTVVLDHERRRHWQRGTLLGIKGTQFFVDLKEAPSLRDGDVLVLDTGDLVEVFAEPEPLIEVRAAPLAALARIAWALGDRHVPVQILADRLRFRPDAALEGLVHDLGGKMEAMVALFEPEGGAYRSDGPGNHRHGEGPPTPRS